MSKIVNGLIDNIMNVSYQLEEIAKTKNKIMLVCWNKDFTKITINYPKDVKLIHTDYLIGTINLDVFNTYEEIEEEIYFMLEGDYVE